MDALLKDKKKRLLAIWPRRCLVSDTQVLMANGTYKEIQDINVGDKILSWDGDTFVTDTVKNVWAAGEKEIVRLSHPGMPDLYASYDHLFAITLTQTSKNVVWKPAIAIADRDYVMHYAGSSHGDIHDPLLGEFLGYSYYGGMLDINHSLKTRLSHYEKLRWDVFKRDGIHFDVGTLPTRYMDALGDLDRASLLHFFGGLISARGRIVITRSGQEKNYPVSVDIFISKSKAAWTCYWLLRKLGFTPRVPVFKDRGYLVKIARIEDIKILFAESNIVGHEIMVAEAMNYMFNTKSDRKRILFKGCFRTRVNKYKTDMQETYDIETERHHNFVANGYLVHNSGKDIAAWNMVIISAIAKVGLYLYLLPTATQARKIIWDGIMIDGTPIIDYIPDEIVESKHVQEMKIKFKNGSIIQLAGSDNYDRLMGINAAGIVFSEYALQDPRAYQYLRPVLTASNGWALFISCVNPDTLVIGKKGLQRIKNVSRSRQKYSDLNEPIYGLGGFHSAEQFYYGGNQQTLIITLACGYTIECTPIHPLWNGSAWIKSSDLRVGDQLPIQYDQNIWGDGLDISGFAYREHDHSKDMLFDYNSNDFFYFLGLLYADGNYDENSVCITNKKDQQIIDFLHTYGFKTGTDRIHHELSSKELCALLEYLGFRHGAKKKTFPEKLFECTREQIIWFLRGLFDGDGSSNSNPLKRGTPKITSACLPFINDLQVLLLNLGVISAITKEIKQPSQLVNHTSTIYNLEVSGYFAHVFYRDIGFNLERKQKNWQSVSERCRDGSENIYPVDSGKLDGYSFGKKKISNKNRISRRVLEELNASKPHNYLCELLAEKLFYSPIKSIEFSSSDVFDFVIPETHSFFSNGFISHNTPRGHNALWAMYQVARDSPDWFCSHLSVHDTQHISLYDIQKEISLGELSEDLAQQEYFTSFDMGIEGSYYAKYIDGLRIKGQIGNDVIWEPSHPCYTSWDIGVRDQTSIVFFQVIGQTVRIIDCYEKNKEGLEHYVKIVIGKPYTYAKHFAPHDMKQMEFGSGQTRWAKAHDLGITFHVVDNIPIIDGIEVVRSTLPRCWFNESSSKQLLKALENYRQEYDAKLKVYKGRPLHDQYSHFADAFRYLCVGLRYARKGTSPEQLERTYRDAVYGGPDLGFFDHTGKY